MKVKATLMKRMQKTASSSKQHGENRQRGLIGESGGGREMYKGT